MSKIDDGGPAFPQQNPLVSLNPQTGEISRVDDGMSLRDWFAGQALSGLYGSVMKAALPMGMDRNELMARAAYEVADAMLLERSKGDKT